MAEPTDPVAKKSREIEEKEACLEPAQTALATQLSPPFLRIRAYVRGTSTVLDPEIHHPLMQPQAQGGICARRTSYAFTF